MAKYICEQCGKVLERYPSRVKQYKHTFCSNECRILYRSKKQLVLCETCGKQFLKKRDQIAKTKHNYCCYKCKYAADTTAVEMKCEHCGSIIHVELGKLKKHKHHFCSRACHYSWRKEHPQTVTICDYCGKEYKTTPFFLKKYSQHYCSRECHGKSRREKIAVICDYCGQPILRKPSQYLANKSNFCSMKCKMAANKGAANSNWRGGISFEPYGVEFNNKLKETIRARDDYTCQECGYTEKQLGRKLSIHHIDYDKRNNKVANLISLCRSCHMQTNFTRQQWTTYFRAKQEGYDVNSNQLLLTFMELS